MLEKVLGSIVVMTMVGNMLVEAMVVANNKLVVNMSSNSLIVTIMRLLTKRRGSDLKGRVSVDLFSFL